MRKHALLAAGLIILVSSSAEAMYIGFTLDELVAKSDTVILARRRGREKVIAKDPVRFQTVLDVKEVWKGQNVPKQIVAEYQLGEGVPQIGPFGNKRDFVAFLTRIPERKENSLPVYEMRLGNDAALLVPGTGDLCASRDLVEAPIGMRDQGYRLLDIHWVKRHVEKIAAREKKDQQN